MDEAGLLFLLDMGKAYDELENQSRAASEKALTEVQAKPAANNGAPKTAAQPDAGIKTAAVNAETAPDPGTKTAKVKTGAHASPGPKTVADAHAHPGIKTTAGPGEAQAHSGDKPEAVRVAQTKRAVKTEPGSKECTSLQPSSVVKDSLNASASGSSAFNRLFEIALTTALADEIRHPPSSDSEEPSFLERVKNQILERVGLNVPDATAANSRDNHLSAEELDQKREQATALLRKSNPEVLGISYAAGITKISLSKPIPFGDNSGGIIFGKPVAEAANVYQVAFAPRSNGGRAALTAVSGIEIWKKGFGSVAVTAIDLQPRAQGYMSSKLAASFASVVACTNPEGTLVSKSVY